MARIIIPPPDVDPITQDSETGRFKWTDDWYDVLKALERLGILDLADVTGTPANGEVLIYSTASKKFAPGAN